MDYTIYQNIDNEWNEQVEKLVLSKNNIPVNNDTVIAFRSMLEHGLNSVEVLEEQIRFVKCFYIYRLKDGTIEEIQRNPLEYWYNGYEFSDSIAFHSNNFYRINDTLYYIEW